MRLDELMKMDIDTLIKTLNLNKDDVLDWLSEHQTAWEDFVDPVEDFNEKGEFDNPNLELWDIIFWIKDHDQLFEDFCLYFGNIDYFGNMNID